ncbi:hypothetical protein [Herbiconiux liangxiaofengii]
MSPYVLSAVCGSTVDASRDTVFSALFRALSQRTVTGLDELKAP